jgi:hypothetical protein
VLGILVGDRVPFVGQRMPFPSAGLVEPAGDGCHLVPVTYQLCL